jgi:hypothetical protein
MKQLPNYQDFAVRLLAIFIWPVLGSLWLIGNLIGVLILWIGIPTLRIERDGKFCHYYMFGSLFHSFEQKED